MSVCIEIMVCMINIPWFFHIAALYLLMFYWMVSYTQYYFVFLEENLWPQYKKNILYVPSKFPFFTWPLIWPHMSSCYVLSVKRGQIYMAPWHRDAKAISCSSISVHHTFLMCGLSISSLPVLLLAPHAGKPSQRTKLPQLRTWIPSGHLGQDLYTFTFCRLKFLGTE